MRNALLYSLVLASCGTASAQIENGGFEQLNDEEKPAYWQGNTPIWNITLIVETGETISDDVDLNGGPYFVNTDDVHSGTNAVELRTGYNFTQDFAYIATWNPTMESSIYGGFPQIMVEVGQQPQSLGFFAKFFPAGGDSAMVSLLVFDEVGGDIGSGTLILPEAVPAYTSFEVPVTYTSTAPAASFALTFSTAGPGGHATLGTRMLVDDVALTLATGVEEQDANGAGLTLYPNPASDRFTITSADQAPILSARVLDVAGQEQHIVRQADGTFSCGHLAAGAYVVSVRTANGETRRPLVVQH